MNSFVHWTDERRRLACSHAGARLNLADVAVEKDFWVCWTLDKLFRLPTWGDELTFKGGTSLSKGWQLIERFSEDIDIVINKDVLGFGGADAPEVASSKKQTAKRIDALRKASQKCVMEDIRPALLEAIAADMPATQAWELTDDPRDPGGQTLLFNYPTAFPDKAAYLRRAVKIELGARSDTDPSDTIMITPYNSDVLPDLLSDDAIRVRAVLPKRTFWEKAMRLHEERFRPAGRRRKEYMARHYYDLYRLIDAGVANEAMTDKELFVRVANHRKVFFYQNWVDYSTLVRGQLRIVPAVEEMPDWLSDYGNMQKEMFFGEAPDFTVIIGKVRAFQETFNKGA